MDKVMQIIMYVLWTIAIIVVVSTTLTDFKYEDLNVLSLVFFAFAILNTFFVIVKK